jgi:invasion protein IalB
MNETGKTYRCRRMTGLRAVLGVVAALSLLTFPIGAGAQNKPAAPKTGAGVKKTTYDRWHLLCQGGSCAAATNAVRGVILFGFNTTDGALVMQLRLPPQSP